MLLYTETKGGKHLVYYCRLAPHSNLSYNPQAPKNKMKYRKIKNISEFGDYKPYMYYI